MKTLHLNLKTEYFDQIKAGIKKLEFRLVTEFWKKRLEGREYDNILIKKGYPNKTDIDRIMEFKWSGAIKQKLTHPHFGDDAVEVYAIILEVSNG